MAAPGGLPVPHRLVDACARAWLALLCEARRDYRWHTSDVRTARPPTMGLALAKELLRRGEEAVRPLHLDAVLDAHEAEHG
jgi:hypothetical protein